MFRSDKFLFVFAGVGMQKNSSLLSKILGHSNSISGYKISIVFFSRIPNAGTAYLEKQGIKYETPWDLWQNIMALGIITIGIMLLAYIQLRRIPKLK